MEKENLKIERRVKITKSKNGNNVLVYYGPEPQAYGYCAIGTQTVAKFIPQSMILDALRLVREYYSGAFLESALDDFYPRIRSVVNKIFNGQVGLLNILSDNADVVVTYEKLFKKAVDEVTANKNRHTPSREDYPWMEEKINPDVLRILGI